MGAKQRRARWAVRIVYKHFRWLSDSVTTWVTDCCIERQKYRRHGRWYERKKHLRGGCWYLTSGGSQQRYTRDVAMRIATEIRLFEQLWLFIGGKMSGQIVDVSVEEVDMK